MKAKDDVIKLNKFETQTIDITTNCGFLRGSS